MNKERDAYIHFVHLGSSRTRKIKKYSSGRCVGFSFRIFAVQSHLCLAQSGWFALCVCEFLSFCCGLDSVRRGNAAKIIESIRDLSMIEFIARYFFVFFYCSTSSISSLSLTEHKTNEQKLWHSFCFFCYSRITMMVR